jgi:hypothetical protein
MTDIAAPHAQHAGSRTGSTATRTGGPKDRREILEHVLGWTLTIVVAMLVVQIHLM